MVFCHKLSYGSTVFDTSSLPHFPESAKRRRSTRKKLHNKQLSAIDLLASVAEGLLLEMEKPGSNLNCNIKVMKDYSVPIKLENSDQGSCNEFPLHAKPVHKRQVGSYTLHEQLIKPKTLNKKVTEVNVKIENVSELSDTLVIDVKPPFPISSGNSMEELGVSNDDDENSYGCTRSYSVDDTIVKKNRTKHVGDHRIRVLASKFWKGSHTPKRKGEISRTAFCKKICSTRQRTNRSSSRKPEIYRHHQIDSYSNGNGESGQKNEVESGECPVNLSIKSIMVPEILIDIPETATIGFLKMSVMKAVSNMVKGVTVGVVYKGKKVCDDTQTLLQSGIAHNNEVADLSFTLEPKNSQTSHSLTCPEVSKVILSSHPSLPCSSAEPVQKTAAIICNEDQKPTSVELVEHSNHDSVQKSSLEVADNSKAIIPVSGMAAGPSVATPFQKSKKQVLGQRRIRRPFSVHEVEALVYAVETLGTGRWRDIKIMAFDDAKHRTYVDLKDKWKTLVHTATIAPQQRRGAPVPQELLDRVLVAHHNWSHHHAKPNLYKPLAFSNTDYHPNFSAI